MAAALVPCGSIIGQTFGPHDAGYRPALGLGVLSVPPALLLRTAVRVAGFGWWTYWFNVDSRPLRFGIGKRC